MFENKIFGSRLRLLRTTQNLTQSDIANILHVTKTQISDIENGKVSTTLDKASTLADYFDVSLDYLTGRSDDPKRY